MARSQWLACQPAELSPRTEQAESPGKGEKKQSDKVKQKKTEKRNIA